MQCVCEKRQAKSVVTYDFSPLYTNIPQNSLKETLKVIIDKCFENSKMKFITINKLEAFWSNKPSANCFSFDKTSLLKGIYFLIDNTFFRCGDLILKQNIGIPMGTDPGPDFANLFLHYYEFSFMSTNTRTKYNVCKKLSKGFRYIDDVLFFNSGSQFETEKCSIYPEELVSDRENVSDIKASFLDIEIEVIDNKFITKLYDKRKDFNFQIVNFPFLCGNIPKKQSYGVFISQIIRFSRVCMEYEDFVIECRILIRKLLKQGYKKMMMKTYCDKLSGIFHRAYNKDNVVVMTDIFD